MENKWSIQFDKKAKKEFLQLPKNEQMSIREYLKKNILESSSSPKDSGKPLKGPLRGFWRYRVGNYRIICQIKNKQLTVLVIMIAHRKEIYKIY